MSRMATFRKATQTIIMYARLSSLGEKFRPRFLGGNAACGTEGGEGKEDIKERYEFLRKIGYKRKYE